MNLILALLLMTLQVFAVGKAALSTLMLESGTRNSALGGSTVALSDDITNVFNNPAAIGNLYGRNHGHFEYAGYWEDSLLPEFEIDGLRHRTSYMGLYSPSLFRNISVGIGYYYNFIGFPDDSLFDSLGNFQAFSTNSHDKFKVTTLAVSYQGEIRLGISYKDLYSNLGEWSTGGSVSKAVLKSSYAIDIGAQVSRVFYYQRHPFTIEPSFGVSYLNLGPDVSYSNISQKDPLPKTLLWGGALKIDFLEFCGVTATYNWNQEQAVRPEERDDPPAFDTPISSYGVEIGFLGLFALQQGWMLDEAGFRNETISGHSFMFDLKRLLAMTYRIRNKDYDPKSENISRLYQKGLHVGENGGLAIPLNLRFSINQNTVHGNGRMGSARNNQQRIDFTAGF